MKKYKINRRLFQIGILCLVAAIIITVTVFTIIKQSVEPEDRIKIPYFKTNISSGSVITSNDVEYKDTPVSLVPNNIVEDILQLEGKIIITDMEKGEPVISTKFIGRGETTTHADDWFQIALKIDSIDNFLGMNIKDGGIYALLHTDREGVERIFKSKIFNILDSSGRIITKAGSTIAATLLIGVENENDVYEIAYRKLFGKFVLVKPPDFYWDHYISVIIETEVTTSEEIDDND